MKSAANLAYFIITGGMSVDKHGANTDEADETAAGSEGKPNPRRSYEDPGIARRFLLFLPSNRVRGFQPSRR
jgi:hypothetical protein